jgi:hypothetical protein
VEEKFLSPATKEAVGYLAVTGCLKTYVMQLSEAEGFGDRTCSAT